MGPSDESNLPDDLRNVEGRLREQRLDVTPMELDQLKQRAVAQFTAGRGSRGAVGSRLVAAVTALALLVGAGGAVALSSLDSHPNSSGGAADKQYKPPHKCKKPKHQKGKKCVKGKHIHRCKGKRSTSPHPTTKREDKQRGACQTHKHHKPPKKHRGHKKHKGHKKDNKGHHNQGHGNKGHHNKGHPHKHPKPHDTQRLRAKRGFTG